MSTKVLADVVEALVGGAFLDGGLARASLCASRLLSEVTTTNLDWDTSSRPAYEGEKSILGLDGLESLLGYTFKDRRLLREALTHPSYENDAETSSYQRLEFIGDAVLDMIVVFYLVDHAPQLPPGRMHLVKTATVNANFLAYICLNMVVRHDTKDVCWEGGTKFKEVHSPRQVRLCQSMRHQSTDVMMALEKCIKRHNEITNEIRGCLERVPCYPWVLLTGLEPEKFLSNIIESIFGAILIDTRGDLEACTAAAQKLGICEYLHRIVADEVDLLHPKNKLGELAGNRTVEYEVKVQSDSNFYRCKVMVGGNEIAAVSNGLSKVDAITRTADAAIKLGSCADVREESLT
jgi:dsRNA-specific ribonuclease